MFRLVKVLNGNNQYEVMKIRALASSSILPGSPLVASSGNVTNSSATVCPDYVSLSGNTNGEANVEVMHVTEDMIFKVEYTGTTAPAVGMTVGMSNYKGKMDGVTYSSSGKGKIVALGDDPQYVYVRFRK